MEAVTPGGTPATMDENATQAKVQETLEGLLSKKNLVRDQFLAGNMNPQMYIPIRVLLAHEKLMAVGADEENVVIAATSSTRLGIDDAKTMVRPLLKSKRNVIILRDVAEGTTEEEVRGIFASSQHFDKIASIKAEVNNTWFVKFDLDDDTQDVVLWLRSQVFKGQPINAAIKSEHFLRSFYPAGPSMPAMPYPQMDMGNPMFYGDMGGNMGMMGPPPEVMMAAAGYQPMQPMSFDFEAMKGKGKGMPPGPPPMEQQGPPSMQPPGFWQPWGVRTQPPPMILPTTVPASSSSGKDDQSKGKGKGGDSWNRGGDSWSWSSWSWNEEPKPKGKESKGKGKGEKAGKGKAWSKGGPDATELEESPAPRKGKGDKKADKAEHRSEGKKWKAKEDSKT